MEQIACSECGADRQWIEIVAAEHGIEDPYCCE